MILKTILGSRAVLLSKRGAPLGFFILLTFLAGISYGQIAGQDTVSQKDTTSSGILRIVIKDTVSGHTDTLASRQDTAATARDTASARKDTLDIITSEAGYNTVPGFRVQLLATQNLLEAISEKSKADSVLTDYNVYIVYDSPYYKVRAGDFRARYEANQAVGYMADHGFPNAWSVPDNVFKNPSRKGDR